LSYAFKRGGVRLSYNHGVTGGSGVFLGASTDQLQVQASRQLTRRWHGNAHFGYAHNSSVITDNTGSITGSIIGNAATYDTFYFGAGVDRNIARNLSFFGAYTAYVQQSSALGNSIVGTGSADYVSHQITLGLSWRTRPFVLR
jgi:hypothetical protein